MEVPRRCRWDGNDVFGKDIEAWDYTGVTWGYSEVLLG